jgi:hypothetical protein
MLAGDNAVRLTLRTLLAYLDDTLEPAQAKLIGQKIAESDQARELIERIQQVTRRRRLTTPPDHGPGGKIDPNTLGEYLDNAVAPEKAAEIEEICLASDSHLAEIAACHQVLSLILGEPALVPPSARQRMYGLVKGPEAIPFRRPPTTGSKGDIDLSDGRDVDDTLRLGLPPVIGKHKGNPLVMVAAGVVAACLLLVAIWQLLRPPAEPATGPNKNNNNNTQVVQVAPVKDKTPPIIERKGAIDNVKQEKQDDSKKDKDEQNNGKTEEKKAAAEVKLPPVVIVTPGGAPSQVVQPIGKLVNGAKDPAILLQYVADKMEWQRIGGKSAEVSSGVPLVSLPAAKSVIQLESGLKLTLVGSMPELIFPPALYESAVVLHAGEQVDLDLTLRRGRIRVVSPERAARIRIRFDNPTHPDQQELVEITTQRPGTEFLVERWSTFDERFFKNANSAERKGPVANLACFVISGSLQFRMNDVAMPLTEAPGLVQAYWNSRSGLEKPISFKKLPEGLKSMQALPPDVDSRPRAGLLRARDDLHKDLAVKAVDVVLAEGLKSSEPAARRLACSCLAALDEVSSVIEALEQEPAQDLRWSAIESLRNWIAAGRDHDYKLYELLKSKYRAFEAETIMTLLHGFGEKELANPDTYDLLIGYLNHPQMPIRELAYQHLLRLVPAGQKIRYSAAADATVRQQAQTAWRGLIPPNQVPPMPMKK